MSDRPKAPTRVHWKVAWKTPDIPVPEAKVWDVPFAEAEQRLSHIARTAIHHAIVSGEAEVVIQVQKASAQRIAGWARPRHR